MSRTSVSLKRSQVDDNSHATLRAHPDRLATLEEAIAEIQQTLEIQFTRIAQIQAQIDLMAAKNPDRWEADNAERTPPTF